MSKDPLDILFPGGKPANEPNIRSVLDMYGIRTLNDLREAAEKPLPHADHVDDACLYNHPAIVAAIRAEAAMENR